MPRASLDHVVESLLGDDRGGRYMDLRLDLIDEASDELMLSVGGRWDRVAKEWRGEAEFGRELALHPGQVEAARWLAGWIVAHRTRTHVLQNGHPVYACALVGGRRGGKSVLALRTMLAFLVDTPGAIGWFVVPTFDDMPEAQVEVEGQLPRAWYKYREYEWTLANGSKLYIRSSRDPDTLKRGRADMVIMNEAQKHVERAYAIVRPAIADRGGLVILTANPPETAAGEWVADFVERAKSGKVGNVVFELDPRRNPHVDHQALLSLKDELDDRTYRREILGEFLARADVVFYAFSPSALLGNVREVGRGDNGERLTEVTPTFLARHFGAPADRLHGIDFGKDQHMAATTLRFFEDPREPGGQPLVWYDDGFTLEQGNEDDLVNALERRGYDPNDVCVIDASGEWQDTDRTKGRASADILRRRGWRRLFVPDPKSKRNPPIEERLAVTNGLFRDANERRRAFVNPTATELIRAFRLWPTKYGAPAKQSEYIHICDAATYPPYRLFPRRAPSNAATFTLQPRAARRQWETL